MLHTEDPLELCLKVIKANTEALIQSINCVILYCYALGFIFVVRIYLFLYLSVYVYHRPALLLLPDYFGHCCYLDT